jgi:tRNA-specific 2-thiouridylase
MLGANYIATGHYVRRGNHNGQATLLKGLDNNKDQSYFLHAVDESALSRSLFPVGELDKSEVRDIAEKNGFVTSKKKDSTGICFIGERRFSDFLQQYLPAQPGRMLTPNGVDMGEHQGLMFYTLGQRQGLGIGGVKDASDEPWFSLEKDLKNNILIVGQGTEHPLLFNNNLSASAIHWINDAPVGQFECYAKTRYRQPDQRCKLNLDKSGACHVVFDLPQRAITPGQSVVFYKNDQCLGGGVIDKAWRS